MKKYLIKLALVLLSIININNMNAQNPSKSNSGLNPHQQSMVKIAALAVVGNVEKLKKELALGLEAGMTVNEIKEALVQLYAYAGFPRSINALNALMAVVEERKLNGIKDEVGKDASPIADSSSKYETGKETLLKLTGKEEKVLTGVNAFAPAIDTFLKEHLFADIFSRDVLNYRQREFVTISALAAMQGVEPQLQAHISMGITTGISVAELRDIFSIIETIIGKKEGYIAKQALANALASSKK